MVVIRDLMEPWGRGETRELWVWDTKGKKGKRETADHLDHQGTQPRESKF